VASVVASIVASCGGSEPSQPQPIPAVTDAPEPAEPSTPKPARPVAVAPEPAPAQLVAEAPKPEPPPPIVEGTQLEVNEITIADLDLEWQRVEDPNQEYPDKLLDLDRGILFDSYYNLAAPDANGVVTALEHHALGEQGEFIEIVGSWPSDAWTFERQRKSTAKLRIMRLVDGVRPKPVLVNGQEWLVAGAQEIRKSTGGGMLVRRKVAGVAQTFERYGAPGGSVTVPQYEGTLLGLLEIPRGEMHAFVRIDSRYAIETGNGRLLLPERKGVWELRDVAGWAPDHLAGLAIDGLAGGYLLVHDASGWSADFSTQFRGFDWVYVAADGTTWVAGGENEGQYSAGPDNKRHTWVLRRTPDGSWGRVKVPTRVYITVAISEDGTEIWVNTDDQILKMSALSTGA
jgi:hypothetical protein